MLAVRDHGRRVLPYSFDVFWPARRAALLAVLCVAAASFGSTFALIAAAVAAVASAVFTVFPDDTPDGEPADAEVEARVRELADRHGVTVRLVYVEPSCYGACWYGSLRRDRGSISVGDELAAGNPDEFEAAVLHELGHSRQRLFVEAMAHTFTSRVALFAFGWAATIVGVSRPVLFVAAVVWVLTVDAVFAARQRAAEFDADRFALQHITSSDPAVVVGELTDERLCVPAMLVWPALLFDRAYSSHPPVAARRAAALATAGAV